MQIVNQQDREREREREKNCNILMASGYNLGPHMEMKKLGEKRESGGNLVWATNQSCKKTFLKIKNCQSCAERLLPSPEVWGSYHNWQFLDQLFSIHCSK